MKNCFQGILKGKTVILGIGNVMKGDDGFGPALVKNLESATGVVCIDAGPTPENYVGPIAKHKPDTVLIVDAMHLGKNAGHYEILRSEDVMKCGFTTHDSSPSMFLEYLKSRTQAEIYFLGVQPEKVSLGDEMSESVTKAINEITDLIKGMAFSPVIARTPSAARGTRQSQDIETKESR